MKSTQSILLESSSSPINSIRPNSNSNVKYICIMCDG